MTRPLVLSTAPDPAPAPPAPSALSVGVERRVYDADAAGDYLSVSTWTIRDWVAAGLLVPLTLPARPPRDGERPRQRFRRLLFDKRELDRFVDACGAGCRHTSGHTVFGGAKNAR